ncbi:MAG: S-methyl-5'-thioadenosine phosphorylase [Anaerolineae bacterium]|nr:S-methyl-5'-thioadenosine phosphorylase [Anaerolineae bacterium]
MEPVRIGVIGGSGLYSMPELTGVTTHQIETPYGMPSDAVRVGTLAGQRVAFIPRHGRGHIYNPTEVPYRANLFALKLLGVRHVIGVSACGSLREEFEPGHIVVPDQLIDRTSADRPRSFFEEGLVVHVSTADPFCPGLSAVIADAVEASGGTVHRAATYVTVEGPRFSTRAESALYRQWGMGIIGMTTSPEAFLAREAEMCYAIMAHVTDYDVWHATEEDVSVDLVVQTFSANIRLAQRALVEAVRRLAEIEDDCTCHHALDGAFITDRDHVPAETLERLWPIVQPYFED